MVFWSWDVARRCGRVAARSKVGKALMSLSTWNIKRLVSCVGGMPRSDLAELLARDKADSKAKFGKWKWQMPQVAKCHPGISWNICKIHAWGWGFKGYLWIWFYWLWIVAWTSETTLSASFVHPWQLLAPQSATEFVALAHWKNMNWKNGWNDGAVFFPSVALAAKRSSRHSRFGTSMQTVSADGTLNAWILKAWKVKKSYCPCERGHRSMLLARGFSIRDAKEHHPEEQRVWIPSCSFLHSCH